MHFHDTYGQALSNAIAALRCGVTTFDASAGGLGGCPYAKSATGNLATEDLVWLLTGLGIEHGVDLDALVETSVWMAGELGRPSPSAVVKALAGSSRVGHTSRMSRVVYLHVGAPKTGTTYLQDRLALNKAALARHGVHYPLQLHASQFRPALDLLEMPWGGLQVDVDGEWDAPDAPGPPAQRHRVVSHEILAAAKPQQVRRAMAGLEGSEVHLVYSARDLARQIPAEWQEGIKHQRKLALRGFLRAGAERASGPSRRCGSGGCRACPTCSAAGARACRRSGCTW